jgi:hypothetical protein
MWIWNVWKHHGSLECPKTLSLYIFHILGLCLRIHVLFVHINFYYMVQTNEPWRFCDSLYHHCLEQRWKIIKKTYHMNILMPIFILCYGINKMMEFIPYLLHSEWNKYRSWFINTMAWIIHFFVKYVESQAQSIKSN